MLAFESKSFVNVGLSLNKEEDIIEWLTIIHDHFLLSKFD
jgi:hypothetical protein